MVTKKQNDSKNLKRKQQQNENIFDVADKKSKRNLTEAKTSAMKPRDVSKKETIPEKETFNFPSLPYVCQRRFAEICDPQTLKTFASINSESRKLSKHLHFIEKMEIIYGGYDIEPNAKYSIKCFCTENEYCNKAADKAHILPKNLKMKVLDKIAINFRPKRPIGGVAAAVPNAMTLSKYMINKLLINFDNVKQLEFKNISMDFNVLKKLINQPHLKNIFYKGCMKSKTCSQNIFNRFLETLTTKMDHFFFSLTNNGTYFQFIYFQDLGRYFPKKENIVINNNGNYFSFLKMVVIE